MGGSDYSAFGPVDGAHLAHVPRRDDPLGPDGECRVVDVSEGRSVNRSWQKRPYSEFRDAIHSY